MEKGTRLALKIVLALVLAGTFVALGLVWRAARRSNVRYQLATVAMERQDWLGAKIMLNRILARDPSSERAMKMMVEVAKADDDPPLEAHWLGRLMKLNEFEPTYADEYRRALLRLRDYPRFADAIDALPSGSRTPDDAGWRVLCAYYSLPLKESRKAWQAWKEKRPAGEESDVIRMVDALFTMEGRSVGEMTALFEDFAKSANEGVRLEALLALGEVYLRAARVADAERIYKEALALDAYATTPELYKLYLLLGRIQDAIALNGAYLLKYPTYRRAIEQAELLTVGKRTDLLPEIAKVFKRNDYNTIALKGYFDALTAYAAGDMEKLYTAMIACRHVVRTPWAYMMAAEADAATDKPDRLAALERDWLDCHRLAPFLKCRERTYAAIKRTIAAEIARGTPPVRLAPLAKALQDDNGPDEEDLELTRVLILAGLQAGNLPEGTLASAVYRHPADPGMLQLAAEAALREGDVQEALDYAERLRKTGTNVTMAASIVLRGRFTLATAPKASAAEFEAATAEMKRFFAEVKQPSAADFRACWIYVNARKRPADIETLKGASAAYAPFCAILQLEASGKRKEALDALEALPRDDPELVYWTAVRLAQGDRNAAAIARYESLPGGLAENPSVEANLSELYAAEGQAEKAFALAERAWSKEPADQQLQAAYARRLAERGNWARIREIVRLPADPKAASALLLAAWIPAVEKGLEDSWKREEHFAVRDASRLLLRYAPDNAVGKKYQAEFETWQAKQRKFAVPGK